MNKVSDIKIENSWANLPPEFYHEIEPEPFKKPHIVAFNQTLSHSLGIDPEEKSNPFLAEYLCGKRTLNGAKPLAMYYAGWQFGVFNPHLGDGRAVLLGQITDKKNLKWDFHLKGSGKTRFSRTFDGRATLRSCIREYLGSEALYHLGIPTTRALCVIGGDETVERKTFEPAAMLLRVSQTHVRFGSFEGFYHRDDQKNIRLLADYVITLHYPEIPNKTKQKYGLFLHSVAEKTATTVAMWQAFGFVHGVMNTDNMSVTGLTIDYGPFGFLEAFCSDHISNSSDHFGRYKYRNQPVIARWNFEKFAKCLQKLVDANKIAATLDAYNRTFAKTYRELMLRKFGFEQERKEILLFIEKTLKMLEQGKVDYHIFLRSLSNVSRKSASGSKLLEKLRAESKDWRNWLSQYAFLLREYSISDLERKKLMDSVNPVYLARNHILQTATREAIENRNYKEIEKIRKLFENPFSEKPGYQNYAGPDPKQPESFAISCSS